MAQAGSKILAHARPQARAWRRSDAAAIHRAAKERRGMTLVEIAFALTILVIGVLGFAQALIIAVQANVAQRESTLAMQAARRTLESVQATALGVAFRTFNADPGDDPGAAGSAAGATFAVRGLQAQTDDADGQPGEIVFPIAPGAASILREDVGDAALGMPRDLDADGVVDAADHSGDYRILPVVVRVRWRGVRGEGMVELKTLLGELQ